jgi:hypothetical protein
MAVPPALEEAKVRPCEVLQLGRKAAHFRNTTWARSQGNLEQRWPEIGIHTIDINNSRTLAFALASAEEVLG